MQNNSNNTEPKRAKIFYLIYIALFGVTWGIGTSVLAGTLPPDPILRTVIIGWFDMFILVLSKLVLLKPYAVTHTMAIATTLSIFTFSFGPPNPFKPLFAISGFMFDLGTGFRTHNLTKKNLIFGLFSYLPTIWGIFVLIFYIIEPKTVPIILGMKNK